MNSNKARILLVDDEPDWISAFAGTLRSHNVEATCRSPEEVDAAILGRADLVLLDLDLGEFSEKTFPELDSPDGLAFAGLLRRQKKLRQKSARPVGFALLSGKVKDLAAPYPPTDRIALLAKQYNLEWIFPKSDVPASAAGAASIAKAIRAIPPGWANGIQSFRELNGPLGLVGAKDMDACWMEIEKCYPPIFEVTQWTHGLAIIRWLLQKILGYPCFLWDENHVAARFRISRHSFRRALKKSAVFRRLLAPASYAGMLHDFAGERWWRHRVEAIAWTLTNGDSQNAGLLRSALGKKARFKFEPSTVDQPVVCLDGDYKPMEETTSFDDAVRIQPDDWPPYADSAWMRIDEVADKPELRALVVHDDRARLPKKAV